jgi:hypothetical protein
VCVCVRLICQWHADLRLVCYITLTDRRNLCFFVLPNPSGERARTDAAVISAPLKLER